ncbi:DUF6980 family protein [Streptomyces sp. NPDC058613]|uniref:DUF6980 family protein n=1 Tax=Streptomyces sp. NPDC058613 TaxID=3346556 RepID=UPI003655804E
MTSRVNGRCDQHDAPFACPDALVGIGLCPWCGQRLPESQRDGWFGELESRGIDPWEGEVAAELLDGRWLTSLPHRSDATTPRSTFGTRAPAVAARAAVAGG